MAYDDKGSSSILKNQGEMNYITAFLAPIFKKLFKGYDLIGFMWGDTTLAASKKDEHAAQMDDETTEPIRGVYVFDQVMAFELACPIGIVTAFMPNSLNVTDYLNSDGGVINSDNSADSRDTVYIVATEATLDRQSLPFRRQSQARVGSQDHKAFICTNLAR
ncbi:hypothetical protein BDA99DRAFT_565155 [Phascolomyces articulosus]|uniref:Uncharacterized protein n=1 Tax=Phascolomyces articulosus TaxID=60185 RepID=A0AAD5K201_9FUNG|nr:hypothetical protein BDA99DRAFT_565155 [Phascolomyces articulosus]